MRRYLPRSAAAVAAAAVVVTAGIAAPAGAGAAPATGRAWARVTPNPSPTYNFLAGVSAVSRSDAWAVGSYNDATTGASKTLILHWNGTAWRQVKSPSPGPVFSELEAVSAVSGSDAWAVGDYWNRTGTASETLILHWNGTAWSQVKSPNPSQVSAGAGANGLSGVSARSGSDAWAIGGYDSNGRPATLILHWDGTAWTQVPSPNVPNHDFSLDGVSAVSGSDAWVVGVGGIFGGATDSTLILHWDGTAWTQVPSPSPSSISYNELHGVSAVSGSDAWAVGFYNATEIGPIKTLILHWNGTAWAKVKSPDPSCPHYSYSYNELYGVSAVSGSDAWAVGDYGDCDFATGKAATLVAHWNGTAWVNASAIPTSTSVSSSANPVTTGSPVTYTATVAHAPADDGGTVAFHDNGSLISSCSHKALSSGRATCTVTYAAAGSHTIKATYSGYADYARSTSPPLTETVNTPAAASVPVSPR